MSIKNIQFLLKKLDEEHTAHLQRKAELSGIIKTGTQKELELRQSLAELKKVVKNVKKNANTIVKVKGNSELVTTIKDLEREIIQNQQQSTAVETELTHERIQLEMTKNKISVLKSEKEELESINLQKKKTQLNQRSESRKVQDKRERLEKLRKQREKQETVKQNLSDFIYVLNLIDQVIQNDSIMNQEEKSELTEVSPEIHELIIEAKRVYVEAQEKFSPNDLTPFLKDADQAYRLGVKALLLLSESIDNKLTDQPFSDQVFAVVEKGLTLNTRHLAAVDSMLQKIEKGVEIAPLASFANEVQEYFNENLSLLRIGSSNSSK